MGMSIEERLHERREARIAEGRAAIIRIKSGDHFRDWVKVADALAALREEAMDAANTPNNPKHPRYRAEIKKLEDREPWVKTIDSATRSHCYWLADHLPGVTAWRDLLAANQREQWNHPTTIKRNYERDQAKQAKAAAAARGEADITPMKPDSLANRHIELQDKHNALLALRGGAFPKLSSRALAELCAEHRNHDWLKQASRDFAAVAEREARQDRIETEKVKKPAKRG
jgi:hypothetical protein